MTKRIGLHLALLAMVLLVTLSACGGSTSGATPTAATGASSGAAPTTATGSGASSGATGQPITIHYLSGQSETGGGYSQIIDERTKEYVKTHPNVKWEFEYIGDTGDLQAKIQQLASANALPTMFGNPANQILADLNSKGKLVDIEAKFKELGIWDQINPTAANLLKSKENNTAGLYELPMELNVEGFWYNKQIFADNGLTEPATWDDMLKDADTLMSKGIQPFSASGQQGWPLTRLIGGYAERVYGPDAMARVASGDLKLTDEGFVKAAQTVKDMADKGYFGKGVTTIDYNTALDTFVQGKAAMFYMGSWALGNYNDPKQNKIGLDNIGFFNIPSVTGGKGTTDDWSMNAGLTIVINKDQDNATLDDWMKNVFGGYGDQAMSELGLITGFKVNNMPTNVSPLTKSTLEKINSAKTAFLWFEALFNAQGNKLSTDNVQTLVTDKNYSAQQYMTDLQKALDQK